MANTPYQALSLIGVIVLLTGCVTTTVDEIVFNEPIEGIGRDALVDGLRSHGHRKVVALESPEDLAAVVNDLAASGDVVVCLGAGTITQWAGALPGQLSNLRGGGAARQGGAGA